MSDDEVNKRKGNINSGDNSNFESHGEKSSYILDYLDRKIAESRKTAGYKNIADRRLRSSQNISKYETEIADLDKKIVEVNSQIMENIKKGKQAELGALQAKLGSLSLAKEEKGTFLTNQRQAHEGIEDQYESIRHNVDHTAYSATIRHVNSQAGEREVASRVSKYKGSSRFYQDIEAGSREETAALEKRSASIDRGLQSVTNKHTSILESGDLDDNGREQIKKLERTRIVLEEQKGIVGGALEKQRKRGEDSTSMRDQAFEDKERFSKIIEKQKIRDDATRGVDITNAKDPKAEFNKLAEAFEEAMHKVIETADKFHKEGGKANEDAWKEAKAAAATASANKDEGQGQLNDLGANRNRGTMVALRSAQRALGAIGEGARFFGYQHDNNLDSISSDVANVHTSMYNDAMSSSRNGDVRAFKRMAVGYNQAADAGQSAYKYGQIATATDAASQAAGAVASGLSTKNIVTAAFNPKAGIAAGAADALPGAIGAAESAMEFKDGVGGAQARLSRIHAQMAKFNAVSEIENTQSQSYLDYSRNLASNSIGMGANGSAAYSNMSSKDFLNKQAAAGVDKEDAMSMLKQGNQLLGKDFDSNDIIKAGNARKAGLMSTDQYIGALGQLQKGGGKSEDLEKIMQRAVTAGMDDSKSIMGMVSSIAEFSSKSITASGLNSTSAYTEMAAKMMSSTDEGLPAAVRTAQVQGAMSLIEGSSTNTNLMTQTAIEMGKYKKLAQQNGLSMEGQELENLTALSTAESAKWAKMAKDPAQIDELKKQMFNSGFDMKGGIAAMGQPQLEKFLGGVHSANRESAFTQLSGFYGIPIDKVNSITKKMGTGGKDGKGTAFDDLDVGEQGSLNAMGTRLGVDGKVIYEGLRDGKSIDSIKKPNNKSERDEMNEASFGARATADSKELVAGMNTLNATFTKGALGLQEAMKELASKMNPAAMAKEQKRASEEFEFKGSKELLSSSTKLEEAAKALLEFSKGGSTTRVNRRIDNDGNAKKSNGATGEF